MTIKVILTTPILNELDEPITEGEKKTPLTMRIALKRIALADLDGDGNPIRGDAKLPGYELYVKIKKADGAEEIEFTSEEAARLSKGARAYPVVVMGQVRDALV